MGRLLIINEDKFGDNSQWIQMHFCEMHLFNPSNLDEKKKTLAFSTEATSIKHQFRQIAPIFDCKITFIHNSYGVRTKWKAFFDFLNDFLFLLPMAGQYLSDFGVFCLVVLFRLVMWSGIQDSTDAAGVSIINVPASQRRHVLSSNYERRIFL